MGLPHAFLHLMLKDSANPSYTHSPLGEPGNFNPVSRSTPVLLGLAAPSDGGNDEILVPGRTFNQQRWGVALPKPFCRLSEAEGLASTLQEKNLFSQPQVWNSPAEHTDAGHQTPVRPGPVHCCPLVATACPALSPLIQSQAEQGNMPGPPGAPLPKGLRAAIASHSQGWRTAPESSWREGRRKGKPT